MGGVVSTKSPSGVKRGGLLGLLLADSVAKVFLGHGTQILRAVGAAIE
jgi:hypothetical protein